MSGANRAACAVAVVGAGPAGLAAAHAAADLGASVIGLDLYPHPGGQYHMRPSPSFPGLAKGKQAAAGRVLATAAEAAGARLVGGAEVFHAERRGAGFRLHAAIAGAALVVDAAAVVVASGAMERALPFKGWTLPGVLGAGAAQRLAKGSSVAPGRRVVLAGTGPFLLAVAATFAAMGLPIAHYVEAARPGPAMLALLARYPSRVREAAGLAAGLARTGARRHVGWTVLEAVGRNRVEAVRIAPIGRDGRPDRSRARTLGDVDALAVGHGFRPLIELTALLGAHHRYDDAAGGWACEVEDTSGATSEVGLFAAGETTGVAGALPARLSGRLAGRHAAAHAGVAVPGGAAEPRTAAALARAKAFAHGLATCFPYPRALLDDLPGDEIVCRCEDVTRGAVAEALATGAASLGAVKMWTRACMGPCQGRVCGPALAEIVARAHGATASEVGYNRPSLPLRPVPLAIVETALAVTAREDAGNAKTPARTPFEYKAVSSP